MTPGEYDPVAVLDTVMVELVRRGVPLEIGSIERATEDARRLLCDLGVAPVVSAQTAYWMGVAAVCSDAAAPVRRTELTGREVDVLRGMAAGQTNAEIGTGLGIAADTVKVSVRRIVSKLDASGRAHAVARGFERGWLRTGPGPGGPGRSQAGSGWVSPGQPEASCDTPNDVSQDPVFTQATVAADTPRTHLPEPARTVV
jgi:DNA-binding CsgD family transcriptional regulator